MAKANLTAERLRELLHYDPETGEFANLVNRRRARVGASPAVKGPHGYLVVVLEYGKYLAHRLAWFYVTDNWPTEIDHINGIKTDNRFTNLREVARRTNQENVRHPRKRVTDLPLGVRPSLSKFSASITVNYKNKYLGTFDSPEEAHAAYLKAKRKLHEGCTI